MDLRKTLRVFLENGITQQFIADTAGVSRRTIYRYLTGETELQTFNRRLIEKALKEIRENIAETNAC